MSEEERFFHVAKVRLLDQNQLRQAMRDTEQFELGDDPDLFFWDAEISNELVDSHFTHMSERTLKNFAEDAKKGVAFLKGHDVRSLPVGYSVDGVFETGEGRKRTIANFYTSRSLPDGVDLITRMEKRLLRDVSVGFHGGDFSCDICHQDYWDCRHFPGLKYEEKGDDGVVRVITATYEIDNAGLSEVSGVYDGSTPNAMIRKAQLAANRGDLSLAQAALLEQRYRIALPLTRTFAVPEVPQGKDEEMTPEERLSHVRSILGVKTDDEVEARITSLGEEVTKAKARIAELEPQAADGALYREALIEEALAEGVRAHGDKFEAESYAELLKGSTVRTIRLMKDGWARVAASTLPAGRSTQGEEQAAAVKEVERVPALGYKI